MKILIVTDAWSPQVNGVVRTLQNLGAELADLGHEVVMITPEHCRTTPCPTYPEIRLSLVRYRTIARRMNAENADAVHLATEGPLGLWARLWCVRNEVPFTTSYHTRFPEYVRARFPVPLNWSYAYMRWFHNAGVACMVTTPTMLRDLEARGFTSLRLWSRGVDSSCYFPRPVRLFGDEKPVLLYCGRVAVEKNIEAFLKLDVPGRKVVVGGGPMKGALEKKYPEAIFTGVLQGEKLAEAYASADLFVFPSRTDTFGVVIIEALASGLPVAAYPVPGPVDILGDSGAGVMDENLEKAVTDALEIPAEKARELGTRFTWRKSAEMFLTNIKAALAGHHGDTAE